MKTRCQHARKKCLLGLVILIATSMPSYADVTTEVNTNRPGFDIEGYDLPSPDPQLCAKACADDARCKAYTYVKPGVQRSLPRCYLKDSVPDAQRSDCCVSGVKTAAPTLRLTTVPSSRPVANAPIQMQDAAVAQGAARQWATQAFVQPALSGFGTPNLRYGQTIGQQWLVRFSVVNPLIGQISVQFDCFNSSGRPVALQHATVTEANGGSYQSGPLVVTGRAAKLINVSIQPGIESWCRATSDKPFLFSASRASYERMANPDEDKIKTSETPMDTFVLMK